MFRSAVPLVLLLALTGCGSTDDTPTAEPSPTAPKSPASPTTTAAPKGSSKAAESLDLDIAPGMLGEVRVGMTRAAWQRTGQLEDGASVCAEKARWIGNPKGIVVITDDQATVRQILVSVRGPRTDHGDIGVGSTYGELRAAYPDLTPLVADGYDGASTYPPGEEDGKAYLGFLLGVPPAEVTDSTPITSIAVTGGEKASFQYDC